MMNLNKIDGEINIAGFKIMPGMSINDIHKLQNKYIIELAVKNAGYVCYRIKDIDDGETAILLTFYHEKIFDLRIGLGKNLSYPPYQINDEKIRS